MAGEGDLGRLLEKMLRRRPRRVVSTPVRGGRRAEILTVGKQGRYVKYRIPQGDKVSDIALLPTIISAVMHSRGGKIEVKKRDYREKVRRKKTSSLISLVVDTSSSMVSYVKMEALQSVLEELLLDAYQKRDRISIVACHGNTAEVVLPFTTSVERGKKLISRLPFGGTTPLSAGLKLGLRNLLEKKATEPAAASLLVLITDGEPNTPERVGGDVREELLAVAEEVKDLSIPFLCIDVSAGGSDVLREIADRADGVYFHARPPGGVQVVDPGLYASVDLAIEHIALGIVNPEIGCVLLEGFDERAREETVRRLLEALVEFCVSEGCPYNCNPLDDENLCHFCRVKKEVYGRLEAVNENMPVVVLDSDTRVEDLWGEVYLRYLVVGGKLSGVRRGVVVIPDPGVVSRDVLVEMGRALEQGRVATSDGFVYPMSFTLVVFGSKRDLPEEVRKHVALHLDLEDVDPVAERTRQVIFRRRFDVDPVQFAAEMEKRWNDRLRLAGEREAEWKSVFVPRKVEWVANRLVENIPGLSEAGNIIQLAVSHALLEGSDVVDMEHFKRAVHETVSLLGEEVRESIGPPESDFADIAESTVVKEKLILPFVNREELKLVLVDGFDSLMVSNATQFIKYLMLKMKTNAGCMFNCDPDQPALWCRECRLRYYGKEVEVEEREVPIVQVGHDVTVEELKGTLYVARVISYNVFSFANRGVVFVESIDQLSDEAAEALADVLKRGENVVTNYEYTESHSARFTVIGTLSRRGAEINPLLLEQATMVVKANYHDWVDMHIHAYASEFEYGKNPEGIIKAVSSAREEAKKKLQRAWELLPETVVEDQEMDLITRICLEFGVEGNNTEALIASAARTLAAYSGRRVVSAEDILHSAQMILPLMVFIEAEAEEAGGETAEGVTENA